MLATILGVMGVVIALTVITGATANLAGSNFEGNDGNLVVNTAGNHDWDNAPNLSVGVDLPTGTGDNSFGNGTKEDETAVTVTNGSIPNSKADLARFAVAGEQVANGDSFLYLAWSRENQSGTVNFDFEINQVAQPDLTTPGAKTLNRTTGDLLINYQFAGGSNTPTLNIRTWGGSSWGSPSDLTGCSEGLTNGTAVNDTLGGNPSVSRPAQQFGEAAINLTCAGIIQKFACKTFADAYVKSRSSTSFTSEIKDFIAPVSLKIAACGKLTIIKHTNPRGLDQAFTYNTTNLPDATFTLNDAGNSGGGDSAGNTKVYTDLHAGTYTVTEAGPPDPTGFAFNNVSCTGGGANTSTSGRVATIGLDPNEDVVCTYVNDQQLGAIKVTKVSTKTGNPPLAGAKFSVTGPGGFSQTLTTGDDGTACVDHLVFGSYSVTETAAPPGYNLDDTSAHPLTVNVNTTCAGSPQSVSTGAFKDTPLTDVTVESKSQAAGGTKSTIVCKDSNGNTVSTGGALAEDSTASAPNLKPGTYTCTVVIDP